MSNVTTITGELERMRLVSKANVARTLDCSVQHVTHLIDRGELTPVFIGPKGVRVTLASLKKFIGTAR